MEDGHDSVFMMPTRAPADTTPRTSPEQDIRGPRFSRELEPLLYLRSRNTLPRGPAWTHNEILAGFGKGSRSKPFPAKSPCKGDFPTKSPCGIHHEVFRCHARRVAEVQSAALAPKSFPVQSQQLDLLKVRVSGTVGSWGFKVCTGN